MANPSIFAAFERMWQHIVVKIDEKTNWNEIGDKPFYDDRKSEEVFNSSVSFANTFNGYVGTNIVDSNFANIIVNNVGSNLEVLLNDKTYMCDIKKIEYTPTPDYSMTIYYAGDGDAIAAVLSDQTLLDIAESTDDPFCILLTDGSLIMMHEGNERITANVSIKFESGELKQLDEKFIPNFEETTKYTHLVNGVYTSESLYGANTIADDSVAIPVLKHGQKVRVLYEDVEYNLEVYLYEDEVFRDNITFIGNKALYSSIMGDENELLVDTGEPFVIIGSDTDEMFLVMFTEEPTVNNHIIISIAEQCKQLKPEYLPEHKHSWDDSGESYIENIEIFNKTVSLEEWYEGVYGESYGVSVGIEKGFKYEVIYGDETYILTSQTYKNDYGDYFYIGGSIDENGDMDFSGCPFIIMSSAKQTNMSITSLVIYANSEGSKNVCIIKKKESVAKIPDKYLLQSDWNQNDDLKGDYIKNKPFYSYNEYQLLIDEDSIYFDNASEDTGISGTYVAEVHSYAIEEGLEYKVVWNNETYLVKAKMYDGFGVCIGNINTDNEKIDFSKYPFFIVSPLYYSAVGSYFFIYTNSGEINSVHISTTKEVVNKIHDKYLPQVDWEENNKTKGTYVLNKPFGEYYTGQSRELFNVELTELEAYGDECWAYFEPVALEIGKSYTVTINGVEYKNLICREIEGDPTVGLDYMYDYTSNSDIPFTLFYMESLNETAIGINDFTGDAIHLIIAEDEIRTKTIDEKYIPDMTSVVMVSPNGSRFSVAIGDDGVLSITPLYHKGGLIQ